MPNLDGVLRPPISVPLSRTVKITGQPQAATAAAGVFGLTITNPGTTAGTTVLVSETANNNAKTDKFLFDLSMPNEMHVGDRASLYIGAYKAGGAGSAVLSVSARELTAGVLGAELLVGTISSGGTIAASAAGTEYEAVLNVGGLNAGDQLQVQVGMVVTASGTVDLNGYVTSLRLADTSDTTPDA